MVALNKWTNDVRRGEHLLHLCKSEDERVRTVLDMISCIEGNEKVIFVSDNEISKYLSSHGVSIDTLGKGFEQRKPRSIFLTTGKFSNEESLNQLRGLIEEARKSGNKSLILIFDHSWLIKKNGSFAQFMQFEASLTFTRFNIPVTFICQCNSSQLNDEQMELATSLHALTLCDGQVSRNYWLIPRSMQTEVFSTVFEH